MSVDESRQLLERTYAAFNEREIERVITLLHPEVDWPNAWEGGRVHGHEEVRAYWTRQFRQIDGKVDPESFETDAEGRIVVDVHQVVHDAGSGKLIADTHVRHRYTIRDGLIERMDVLEE